MKLKLLFFPISIIIAVSLSIWVIKPEVSAILGKHRELEEKKKSLEKILEKKTNINRLIENLDANSEKVKRVSEYLPSQKEEDELINKINKLASGSGVALAGLSISGENTQSRLLRSSASGGKLVSGETQADAAQIAADVSVVGNYGNIRSFFDSLKAMEKLNEITLVSISRSGEDEERKTSKDQLSVSVNLSFAYLKPTKVEKNMDLAIFNQGGFDFSIADDLEKLVTKKIAPLEIGEIGKPNPFFPN